MTTLGIGPEARRRLGSRRTAEIVADELRRQIVDGELADGDLLPPQAVLVERFNVSLVSLREALRILETEGSGVCSARQPGRRGGARPRPNRALPTCSACCCKANTYPWSILRTALRDLEPTCAALAAQRADRITSLVPELNDTNYAATAESLADGTAFHRSRTPVPRRLRARLRQPRP